MAVSEVGTAFQVPVHGWCAYIALFAAFGWRYERYRLRYLMPNANAGSGAGLDALAPLLRGLLVLLVGDEAEAEVEERLDRAGRQLVEQRAGAADRRRDVARPPDDRLLQQLAGLAR